MIVCLVTALVVGVATAQDARQLRRQGDDALLLRRWDEAVDVLSKSIALEPENFLGFLKRASAYQGLGKLNEAVQDLTKVLAIKPDHAKAVVKRAELFVSLGRYLEAQHSLFGVAGPEATALLATTSRLVMLRNTITQFAERKEFANAIRTIDEMVAAGANRDLLAMEKCKLAFESGQYYDVVAEAMSLLKKDAANTDALLIRARSFFMLGEVDACVNHLKQCIRVQPDHTACGEEYKRVLAVNAKREAATTLFKSNQWMQSVTPLREAIEAAKPVAALQLELTAMLCEAFEKGATSIAQWTEGVAACTAAMAVPGASDAMKEWRGNLHQKLGNWNEAIQDFSAVLQTQPNNMRMRQRIQEVQNAKKVAERKDYYKILDVPRDANPRQIKTAFRKLALQWHPDKFSEESEREKANKMFQDLNEAYDVLTSEDKKARYDRGEDVEQPQQQQHHNPFGGFGFGGQQFTFKFN